VRLITRVVDYGGVFHDDVRPGHVFPDYDHRRFRPGGWVEDGVGKLELMRPYAERHGMTMLQLACVWTLAQPAVACVAPTLIQEAASGPRPPRAVEDKRAELAAVPALAGSLSAQELEEIAAIGRNANCMALKGGSSEHEGDPLPDRWELDERLGQVAARWGIDPRADLGLAVAHDVA